MTKEEIKIVQDTFKGLYGEEDYNFVYSQEKCKYEPCALSKLKCTDGKFRYIKKLLIVKEGYSTVYWCENN